jgi:transposase
MGKIGYNQSFHYLEAQMVTDRQVRRLMMLINQNQTLSQASSKAGMDEKTARKYLQSGQLPSQMCKRHTWRTRQDPFKDVWNEVVHYFENPGLESKTVFRYLQENYPGRFEDGQLRTFQRKVKRWRAENGPGKEVFFPQKHYPGELSSSDFTHMSELEITISGALFDHLVYHFVLTYSNWETGCICFSENFESLSRGFQNGFWELGGVTRVHRTDNLTAAVYSDLNKRTFTARYNSLLKHYGVEGVRINPGRSNENGDVEQSHNRFKKAVEQALILRGSRDFSSRDEYQRFLRKIFTQLNFGRQKRFKEELSCLRRLPRQRLEDFKKLKVKVGPSSTISVCHNVYSVHSRLIGERVEIRLYSDLVEVWYGQKMLERMERLRGEQRHHIQYRHIIDWLVRKPGAFENYRYRDDLFPTTRFRMAYDQLRKNQPLKCAKEYLQILYLAATELEVDVDNALRILFDRGQSISLDAVKTTMEEKGGQDKFWFQNISVSSVDLSSFDQLLSSSPPPALSHSPQPHFGELKYGSGKTSCYQQ